MTSVMLPLLGRRTTIPQNIEVAESLDELSELGRKEPRRGPGFFGYVLWFFFCVFFYGFLGLDCREPVKVSEEPDLGCFFMVFWAWVVENLQK